MAAEPNVPPVGSTAPPFSLRTERGEERTLASYLELGPVLLAFHRGTW
jgi:peroxiredoxin